MKPMEKPTGDPRRDPDFDGGQPFKSKPFELREIWRRPYVNTLKTSKKNFDVFDNLFNNFGKIMGGGFCLFLGVWVVAATAGIGVVGFAIWCILQIMQFYGFI